MTVYQIPHAKTSWKFFFQMFHLEFFFFLYTQIRCLPDIVVRQTEDWRVCVCVRGCTI